MAGLRPVLITGGRIVTMRGEPIDVGDLLITAGRIDAVGTVQTAGESEELDATGKWVLPGFIDAHTHLGVHEESTGAAGDDTNESSMPNTAGVRAIDAVNIEDPGFRDCLEGGVTTVIVRPGSANPIGGLTVAMKTWGGLTVDDQAMEPELSVKSALGENPKTVFDAAGKEPKTRMGVAHVIRQALLDVRAEGGAPDDRVSLHSQVIARLLNGDLPWDVHAHRHDDIATAMRIAKEFGLRLILQHGTEAYRLADLLAEAGIPVVYGPTMTARSKVELSERSPECIVTLAEAGVRFALTTDHREMPIEFLVHEAAMAVKDGLHRDLALAAITSSPAELYGLETVGALAPGMDGDVVIWSGDPLDLRSSVEQVFIRGVLVFDRRRSSPVIERSELWPQGGGSAA